MAERLIAPVLKTGDGETRSRVQIPAPPFDTFARDSLGSQGFAQLLTELTFTIEFANNLILGANSFCTNNAPLF